MSALTPAQARTDRQQAEARRAERKADMIFLEALRHKEQGDLDAYADLVVRAYQTNPSDPYLGWEYGRFVMATTTPEDSATASEAYALMRDYAVDGDGARDFYTVSVTSQTADRLGRDSDARLMLKRLYESNPTARK